MEIWADIPRYLGYYQASSLGRIRRCKLGGKGSTFGRVLRPGQQANGYLMVVLSVGCKTRNERVHRLVAEAFHGFVEGMEIRHLDGNVHNNAPDNLVWGTRRENMADAKRHGTWMRGAMHPGSKLTDASAIAIFVDTRKSAEIAEDYGVSRSLVEGIKSGKRWTHATQEIS